MDLNWYPGHMAGAERMIKESLALVDVVIEMVDARIPSSGKNPAIEEITKNKKRMLVFNKWDLCDKTKSKKWMEIYKSKGYMPVAADCSKSAGISDIEKAARLLAAEKIEKAAARGIKSVQIRAMVAGMPNVGKSTLINRYADKKVAKAEDRPGITKNNRWIKVKKDFEILDTPGVLARKLDDRQTALFIALTGGIKDELADITALAEELLRFIVKNYPESLNKRYGADAGDAGTARGLLDVIGRARGCLLKGGSIDAERTAIMLVDEFRAGKLGGMTLDEPVDLI